MARTIIARTKTIYRKFYLNKVEKRMWEIIEKYHLPFIRGDRWFRVGKNNPDFVDCRDKIVLEIFGDYWHNPEKFKKCSYKMTEEGKVKSFNEQGWACIVIWESEIKNSTEEQIVKKIEDFILLNSKKDDNEVIHPYFLPR